MLETVDFTEVKRAAQNLVDDAWDDDPETAERAVLHKTSNYREAVFEAVMEALYGPSFFAGFYIPRVDEVDG